MGPSTEALALARKLLEGTPYADTMVVEFAYELQRMGEAMVEAMKDKQIDFPDAVPRRQG